VSGDDITVMEFIDLFRGRADVYGSWEGGCVRQPLTRTVFDKHLGAGPHIGVYCNVPYQREAHTVWGCSDIDYDDYGDADRLRQSLALVDVPAWVEKTRKGWHVWVFCTMLINSRDMRNMLLATHQVAKVKPTEVNPKQVGALGGEGLGNYVRLPYPGGNDATERYVVDSSGVRLSLEDFVHLAHASRVTPEKIAEVAGYYIEPQPIRVPVQEPIGDMAEAARLLTPLGRVIFRDGPIEGRDRSTTLTHLAHEAAKAGIAPGDALAILEDADLRWGKYLMRGPAGEAELLKLIERAYGPILST
jgi:hypothetical protein